MRSASVLFISIFISIAAFAQSDTLAPYQKSPDIPAFKMQLPDSSWFSRANIQTGKPALVLYFSPDCGHCQLETEELLSKMKQLNDLQIIMVTSRPFEDMTAFADKYKINRFPSIRIGTDPDRIVTRFYDVKFTPFSALYDRKGKLVKVYKEGIDMDEFPGLLK